MRTQEEYIEVMAAVTGIPEVVMGAGVPALSELHDRIVAMDFYGKEEGGSIHVAVESLEDLVSLVDPLCGATGCKKMVRV